MIATQHGRPNWTQVFSLWIICLFDEELAQLEYNCVVIDVALACLFFPSFSSGLWPVACLLKFVFKILFWVTLIFNVSVYLFQMHEIDFFVLL